MSCVFIVTSERCVRETAGVERLVPHRIIHTVAPTSGSSAWHHSLASSENLKFNFKSKGNFGTMNIMCHWTSDYYHSIGIRYLWRTKRAGILQTHLTSRNVARPAILRTSPVKRLIIFHSEPVNSCHHLLYFPPVVIQCSTCSQPAREEGRHFTRLLNNDNFF